MEKVLWKIIAEHFYLSNWSLNSDKLEEHEVLAMKITILIRTLTFCSLKALLQFFKPKKYAYFISKNV